MSKKSGKKCERICERKLLCVFVYMFSHVLIRNSFFFFFPFWYTACLCHGVSFLHFITACSPLCVKSQKVHSLWCWHLHRFSIPPLSLCVVLTGVESIRNTSRSFQILLTWTKALHRLWQELHSHQPLDKMPKDHSLLLWDYAYLHMMYNIK